MRSAGSRPPECPFSRAGAAGLHTRGVIGAHRCATPEGLPGVPDVAVVPQRAERLEQRANWRDAWPSGIGLTVLMRVAPDFIVTRRVTRLRPGRLSPIDAPHTVLGRCCDASEPLACAKAESTWEFFSSEPSALPLPVLVGRRTGHGHLDWVSRAAPRGNWSTSSFGLCRARRARFTPHPRVPRRLGAR